MPFLIFSRIIRELLVLYFQNLSIFAVPIWWQRQVFVYVCDAFECRSAVSQSDKCWNDKTEILATRRTQLVTVPEKIPLIALFASVWLKLVCKNSIDIFIRCWVKSNVLIVFIVLWVLMFWSGFVLSVVLIFFYWRMNHPFRKKHHDDFAAFEQRVLRRKRGWTIVGGPVLKWWVVIFHLGWKFFLLNYSINYLS